MHHVINLGSHVLRPVTSWQQFENIPKRRKEEEKSFLKCYLQNGSLKVHSSRSPEMGQIKYPLFLAHDTDSLRRYAVPKVRVGIVQYVLA